MVIIYLDMDGVLADFDGWLASKGIINDKSFIHLPKHEWTESQKETDKLVTEFMRKPGFFRDLPEFSYTKNLWNYCHQNYYTDVLTARPNIKEFADRIEQEKYEWCVEHLPEFNSDDFICCLRSEKRNFVPYPDDIGILIDDNKKNCEEWADNKGIAILHTDYESTIDKLQKTVLGLL